MTSSNTRRDVTHEHHVTSASRHTADDVTRIEAPLEEASLSGSLLNAGAGTMRRLRIGTSDDDVSDFAHNRSMNTTSGFGATLTRSGVAVERIYGNENGLASNGTDVFATRVGSLDTNVIDLAHRNSGGGGGSNGIVTSPGSSNGVLRVGGSNGNVSQHVEKSYRVSTNSQRSQMVDSKHLSSFSLFYCRPYFAPYKKKLAETPF